MLTLKNILRIATLCGLMLAGLNLQAATTVAKTDIRLYTLNCGSIDLADGASFLDTGLYPHQPLLLADPCFLIKHGKTWLLWDLGLGDKYVNHRTTLSQYGVTFSASTSLVSQLKEIGLTPNDITYVGLSHAHLDHVGNIGLFPHSTVVMQRKEYQFIQQTPEPQSVEANLFPALKPMHKILLNGDYDLFGDGTVIMLRTPGHTPGHQSLEITLPHSGVVILSGDLYHVREAYLFNQVPEFNDSRAETLASMARVKGILKNTQGRLVIQHDPKDFAAMPKFPKYLN